MKKKNIILFKICSTSGSGHFYLKNKNIINNKKRISFKKYDPIVRKHFKYIEKNI